MRFVLITLYLALTSVSCALASSSPNCHIHSPADQQTSEGGQLLPSFVHYKACQRANKLQYSGLGRCHCGFGRLPQNRILPMDDGFPLSDGDALIR